MKKFNVGDRVIIRERVFSFARYVGPSPSGHCVEREIDGARLSVAGVAAPEDLPGSVIVDGRRLSDGAR